LDTTVYKTNRVLAAILQDLGWSKELRNRSCAALRDRLAVEEAARFGAQLPMLTKRLYCGMTGPTGSGAMSGRACPRTWPYWCPDRPQGWHPELPGATAAPTDPCEDHRRGQYAEPERRDQIHPADLLAVDPAPDGCGGG
jgi:hypothetical protein